MKTPLQRLEAFERKHGDYYELLDAHCKTTSEYDYFTSSIHGYETLRSGIATQCEYENSRQRARQTLTLLKRHHELVAAYAGYMQGYQDGLRDGANIPPTIRGADHVFPTPIKLPTPSDGVERHDV